MLAFVDSVYAAWRRGRRWHRMAPEGSCEFSVGFRSGVEWCAQYWPPSCISFGVVEPLLLTVWDGGDTINVRLGERIRPLPIAGSSLPYTGGVCEAAI